MSHCALGCTPIAIDHDGLAHDELGALITNSIDRTLGTNPVVLSAMDFTGIFVDFHRFDIDVDRGTVGRTSFQMHQQIGHPTEEESRSIAMNHLRAGRRLLTHDHPADRAFSARQGLRNLTRCRVGIDVAGGASREHADGEGDDQEGHTSKGPAR